MHAIPVDRGVCVTAYSTAVPFYLFCDRSNLTICHNWYKGFDLAMERYRGLRDREDHLHIATFEATLQPGESLTIIASTESQPNLQVPTALEARRTNERTLLKRWQTANYLNLASKKTPSWINQ
jgi:hypothetical protein